MQDPVYQTVKHCPAGGILAAEHQIEQIFCLSDKSFPRLCPGENDAVIAADTPSVAEIVCVSVFLCQAGERTISVSRKPDGISVCRDAEEQLLLAAQGSKRQTNAKPMKLQDFRAERENRSAFNFRFNGKLSTPQFGDDSPFCSRKRKQRDKAFNGTEAIVKG